MEVGEWFTGSLSRPTGVILHELTLGWLSTIVDSDGIVLLEERVLFRAIFIILTRGGWLSPAVVSLIVLANV